MDWLKKKIKSECSENEHQMASPFYSIISKLKKVLFYVYFENFLLIFIFNYPMCSIFMYINASKKGVFFFGGEVGD